MTFCENIHFNQENSIMSTSSTGSPSVLDNLLKTAAGFQASCVLAAAAEWDLFTAVIDQRNSATAETLATQLEADKRALTVLLDALAALGFLEKNTQHCYSVPEQYLAYFDSRVSTTVIPMLHHQGCCNRSWTQIAAVLKSGEFAKRPPSIRGQEADYVAFILAMNSIARTIVEPLCQKMKENGVFDLGKKAFRFLDVGGASGTYTLAILKHFPESNGVIFDLPVAINEAKKRFAGTEYESRLTFVEGDFYND